MFTLSSDRRIILMRSILVVPIFLAPNLHYTDGKIVLPLDDSYIYAQYTKSIAEGHPFRFTPGAEPSAGTTGLLYPFIHAPFYLLNFRGDLFPPFIFFINGILFIISSLLIYELTGRKNDRDKARLGTWLFILSGSMAWGFLSGMEIGLFITIWLSLAIALNRGKETMAIVFASMIVLIRPTGLLWCFILWIILPLLSDPNHTKKKLKKSAPGFLGNNQFHKTPSKDGHIIMDGGRGIFGSLSMRLFGIHPGKDLITRMRILPITYNNKLQVYVDGKPIGNWFLLITNKGRWLESMVIIKSPIITKETIQLTLSGMFMPFHIWTIEKIEKSCYQ